MRITRPEIFLIGASIALNVALGSFIFLLKLPLYIDSVGIAVCALLVPGTRHRAFLLSALVAVVSFVLGGLLVNPFLPWFSLTGVAGAAYWSYLGGYIVDVHQPRSSLLLSLRLILAGILWGVIAAAVSAPVVVYLFGGVTASGTALLVAYFVKTGQQLLNAAIYSGLTAEPIDKVLQTIIAYSLCRNTPKAFLRVLGEPT